MLLIAAALIVMVGTAFIVLQVQEEFSRPQTHLSPYDNDTTDLNLVVVGENIEIRIVSTGIYTMDPHLGPKTLSCSVRINVTNTGQESIDDFEPMVGTAFTSENEIIYSFWFAYYGHGFTIEIEPIQANTSGQILCGDIGRYAISDSDYESLPNSAYVRLQFSCGEEILTITSPLTMILHTVE